jgi:hypothetical protein
MKILCAVSFLWIILIVLSCNPNRDYNPESYLTVREKDLVLQSIIRYMGKPPENVSASERFDSKHEKYYLDIASRYRFDEYYIDEDNGTHYFLISRPAPSLYEKRVAIGGRLKLDEKGGLSEYEEIFRTWKMKEEDLKVKGLLLFDLMVNGKDLSPYYRINSSEEYIEFPDEYNYYNKSERMWKLK